MIDLYCYCGNKISENYNRFNYCSNFCTFIDFDVDGEIVRLSIYIRDKVESETNYTFIKSMNIIKLTNKTGLNFKLDQEYITKENLNKADKIILSLMKIQNFL
jgi:hypothetical protein